MASESVIDQPLQKSLPYLNIGLILEKPHQKKQIKKYKKQTK